jgi:hypothetical protein
MANRRFMHPYYSRIAPVLMSVWVPIAEPGPVDRSTKDWIEPQLVIGVPFNFLELCVRDLVGRDKFPINSGGFQKEFPHVQCQSRIGV